MYRDYGVHEMVKTPLSNRIPEAGIWIGKLYKLRTFADYNIDRPLPIQTTKLLSSSLILS